MGGSESRGKPRGGCPSWALSFYRGWLTRILGPRPWGSIPEGIEAHGRGRVFAVRACCMLCPAIVPGPTATFWRVLFCTPGTAPEWGQILGATGEDTCKPGKPDAQADGDSGGLWCDMPLRRHQARITPPCTPRVCPRRGVTPYRGPGVWAVPFGTPLSRRLQGAPPLGWGSFRAGSVE